MHRIQAELLEDASELVEKLAAKRKEKGADGGSPLLWKYTDPDSGKEFWLTERLTPVKSPFTGKPVSQRPKRETIPNVQKDVKQLNAPAGGPGGKVNTKRK